MEAYILHITYYMIRVADYVWQIHTHTPRASWRLISGMLYISHTTYDIHIHTSSDIASDIRIYVSNLILYILHFTFYASNFAFDLLHFYIYTHLERVGV